MDYRSMFNKSDYGVLELLIAEECFSPIKSLSKQYIMKSTGFSHVKVQQVLRSFILVDFVKEGLKSGNNKTYFCTEKGKEHYMDMFNYTEEDLEELMDNNYEEKHNKE